MYISIEKVIELIENCRELELPNGATRAIWKDDIIELIENYRDEE
jgi:hypothetical protein